MANWYESEQAFSRSYDNFVVPSGGWTINGVFSLNAMNMTGITEVLWEIRTGVSSGNGGKVFASGRSPATQTLQFTWPDGENIYRLEVDGLRVRLPAGTYWLSVSPVVPHSYNTQSFMCTTVGKNAVGSPPGNDGEGYFHSNVIPGNVFLPAARTGGAGTSADSSQGILVVGSNAPAPVISSVVNAASWQSGAVAPGEIVTILGTGLADATCSTLMLDHDGKVSTSLDGVQVTFNGIASPQTYVGNNQINAVVPYEVAGAASLAVQVNVAGQASNSFTLTPAAAAPALFTATGTGTGQAAVLNQDYTYNGANKPAAHGSYITLYLTGEGQTQSAVTGKITTMSSTGPLTPQPLLPVTVTIGGQSATVAFYGEAPNMVAGVMQLNVIVPNNISSGNQPIVVGVGNAASPAAVTIAVQ